MGKTILIKSARIIDPSSDNTFQGDIFIRDGLVAEIQGMIATEADIIIDASNLCAAPGLVDMHVHTRDPGQTYKDDILTVSACAAAGGITSMACMPNTIPPVDNENVLDYILQKAAQASARVYPVAAVTLGLQGGQLTDKET